MKRVIIIIICIFYSNIVYGKIGINIIPVKPANEEAILSGINNRAERILEQEFSQDSSYFNLRIRTKEYFMEWEAKFSGLFKNTGYKQLEEVDYFIITTVGSYNGLVMYDIRVMDTETVEVICGIGETVSKNKFEDKLINSIAELKEILKNKAVKEEYGKDIERITIYKIKEDGNRQMGEAVTGMLFTGLNNTGGFKIIEREQMNWALKEKEAVMSGLINRDPLKKAKRFYDVQLAIEGYVVTKNKGMISLELKLIDVEKASLIFSVYDECYSEKELRGTIERIVKRIARKYLTRLGKLEVVSIPPDASVYINGHYLARTPCLITELEIGLYKLMLNKKNYKNYLTELEIIPGKKVKVRGRLERIEWEYYKLGIKYEQSKKWKKAIPFYTEFINKYFGTKEAKDAKFRIAHIYQYGLKEYTKAIKHYDELIKSYSGLKILSESMYGKGQCLIIINKREEGLDVLKRLISEYPETSASEYAREYLREI